MYLYICMDLGSFFYNKNRRKFMKDNMNIFLFFFFNVVIHYFFCFYQYKISNLIPCNRFPQKPYVFFFPRFFFLCSGFLVLDIRPISLSNPLPHFFLSKITPPNDEDEQNLLGSNHCRRVTNEVSNCFCHQTAWKCTMKLYI